jgi:hypothetical protein
VKLKLSAPLALPRSHNLRHPRHAGGCVWAVREDDQERSGLALLRDRRQPLPNVTAPEALMAFLEKIAAGS